MIRDADWFESMRRFYRDVDKALAARGESCRRCGECCRFDWNGHVLYASRLERLYLLRISPRPASGGGEGLVARGLRCPYQAGNGCLAREGRTLGCRLHFCSGLDGEFSEQWHQLLKRLHDDFGLAWSYAPLLPLDPEPGGRLVPAATRRSDSDGAIAAGTEKAKAVSRTRFEI